MQLRASIASMNASPGAGPVTVLNWSFPRKDITRQAQAFQLAAALREEVADLEAAGCKVIQVETSESIEFQGIFIMK